MMNFLEEQAFSLTKCTADKVAAYKEEMPSFKKKSGYRAPRNLTTEDQQKIRRERTNYQSCPWYSLEKGQEIMKFTPTTKGARLWKRIGTRIKMFIGQADIAFLFIAHDMYMERRKDEHVEAILKELPRGARLRSFSK